MAKKLVASLVGKRGFVLAASAVAAIVSAKCGYHAQGFGFFDG